MAEHTHVLLEKLIAVTQANADELRLLRLALVPRPDHAPPPPVPEAGILAEAYESANASSDPAFVAVRAGNAAKRAKGGAAR